MKLIQIIIFYYIFFRPIGDLVYPTAGGGEISINEITREHSNNFDLSGNVPYNNNNIIIFNNLSYLLSTYKFLISV